MDMGQVKKIVESRNMIYKGNIIEQLTEEEFKKGVRRVNLQLIDDLNSLNGEGCWAWMTEENIKKYEDNKSDEVIDAILVNTPLNYMDILYWGSEIRIRCNRTSRPTLDKDWVKEKILESDWYKALE